MLIKQAQPNRKKHRVEVAGPVLPKVDELLVALRSNLVLLRVAVLIRDVESPLGKVRGDPGPEIRVRPQTPNGATQLKGLMVGNVLEDEKTTSVDTAESLPVQLLRPGCREVGRLALLTTIANSEGGEVTSSRSVNGSGVEVAWGE